MNIHFTDLLTGGAGEGAVNLHFTYVLMGGGGEGAVNLHKNMVNSHDKLFA